ncbi:acyl-CoA thioesterase [Nostoc sp. C117]|uniref:acyl-CoA thioesterase n=1 Tax=Nostoc sp. C117 TaxID=3349875 RepID=UPI00370DB4AC
MIFQQSSIFTLTVQFEDVDANGVVHHPNYLKYLERARFYGIKQCGYSLEKLSYSGLALVVSEIHANYLRPATIEQELFVISRVIFVGKSSVKICQSITSTLPTTYEEIEKAGEKFVYLPETIFWSQITLACVDLKSGKPKSIPLELKQAIKMFNNN